MAFYIRVTLDTLEELENNENRAEPGHGESRLQIVAREAKLVA